MNRILIFADKKYITNSFPKIAFFVVAGGSTVYSILIITTTYFFEIQSSSPIQLLLFSLISALITTATLVFCVNSSHKKINVSSEFFYLFIAIEVIAFLYFMDFNYTAITGGYDGEGRSEKLHYVWLLTLTSIYLGLNSNSRNKINFIKISIFSILLALTANRMVLLSYIITLPFIFRIKLKWIFLGALCFLGLLIFIQTTRLSGLSSEINPLEIFYNPLHIAEQSISLMDFDKNCNLTSAERISSFLLHVVNFTSPELPSYLESIRICAPGQGGGLIFNYLYYLGDGLLGFSIIFLIIILTAKFLLYFVPQSVALIFLAGIFYRVLAYSPLPLLKMSLLLMLIFVFFRILETLNLKSKNEQTQIS